jgi:hypothetical protein
MPSRVAYYIPPRRTAPTSLASYAAGACVGFVLTLGVGVVALAYGGVFTTLSLCACVFVVGAALCYCLLRLWLPLESAASHARISAMMSACATLLLLLRSLLLARESMGDGPQHALGAALGHRAGTFGASFCCTLLLLRLWEAPATASAARPLAVAGLLSFYTAAAPLPGT